MNDAGLEIVRTLVGGIVSGCLTLAGVVLAAHLALKKFHAEKTWERKEAAYTQVLSSLHVIVETWDALIAALKSPENLSDLDKMNEPWKAAGQHLERLRDLGAWHLSEDALLVLAGLERQPFDVGSGPGDPQFLSTLKENREATVKALREIRAIAVAELKESRSVKTLLS